MAFTVSNLEKQLALKKKDVVDKDTSIKDLNQRVSELLSDIRDESDGPDANMRNEGDKAGGASNEVMGSKEAAELINAHEQTIHDLRVEVNMLRVGQHPGRKPGIIEHYDFAKQKYEEGG